MPPASLDGKKALEALLGQRSFVESINFEEVKESFIYLIPRAKHLKEGTASAMVAGEDERIKVIPVPYNFNFHFANAYEDEDGDIVIDSVVTDKVEFGISTNRNVPIWETVMLEDLDSATYKRIVVDPIQKSLKKGTHPETISSREPEFPSIPRELSTKKHRYVYTCGAHQEFEKGKGANGAVLKIDIESPQLSEAFSFLPHEFVGEQVFCAKKGVDVTQPGCEDKGYLVTYVENRRDLTTDLVVFDVEGKGALEQGPVTRVRLPTYIPPGLHGIFVDGLNFRTRTTTQSEATFDDKQKYDVTIFGGGFGGLYTALSIDEAARRRNQRIDIALVDPSDRFVFLPLLYDLVAGTASRQEVCPRYDDLLQNTNIRHVQGTLQNITFLDRPTARIQDAKNPSRVLDLEFGQGIISIGATPQSILARVPGALKYAQPFYTLEHAIETRRLLERLERASKREARLNIAVVGGGYGGVELAACLQRRFGKEAAQITLLARSPPLQGTRAEFVVETALQRLGVKVELCTVDALEPVAADTGEDLQVYVRRKSRSEDDINQDLKWDAVFWTAGSTPSDPVSSAEAFVELERINGRLATDKTLRCCFKSNISTNTRTRPPLWALGDCSEIIGGVPIPRTAQVAMQQANVVANNVCLELGVVQDSDSRRMNRNTPRAFTYQDLGSMMMLGGADGIIAAPPDSSSLGPVFAPLLDTARAGLNVADSLIQQQQRKSKNSSTSPLLANLSLGGYGLVPDQASGSLGGTLAGAARRAVYAARMPTNRQKAYAAASATLSTFFSLAKEASQSAMNEKRDGE
jgi:NADH dehydrogenase FAD-containing subunit